MLVKPAPASLSDVSAVIFHRLIRTLSGWECTLPNQACLAKHRRRRGRGHGWLDKLDRERGETTLARVQTGRTGGDESPSRWGVWGLCNLNANDLFQGRMCQGPLH